MARFPRREGEMVILADDMINGLEQHGSHFPSADRESLKRLRKKYQDKKEAQLRALEIYKNTTEEKDHALKDLVMKMKNVLGAAEEDVEGDRAMLERIGWGGASEVTTLPPPGPPRELESKVDEKGRIHLHWKQPVRGAGGKVAVYEVERAELIGGHREWILVATAFDTKIVLDEQAGRGKAEYRVIAKNQQGSSPPSNVIEAGPSQ